MARPSAVDSMPAPPLVDSMPVMGEDDCPLLICLFGIFRVLHYGQPIALRSGGKAEGLLFNLALHYDYGVPRDRLLNALWVDSCDQDLASQALSTLTHSISRLLGPKLHGSPPILHGDGSYRLNSEAGIHVDVERFNTLIKAGNQHVLAHDHTAAVASYRHAVWLYRGDLSVGTDIHATVERECLRARYLTALAWLADYYFAQNNYAACLDYALQLLRSEPCREDAHRVVMRCYVRRGERAQALRQYRLCEQVLRAEFDVSPEPATAALFEHVRRDPDTI